MDKEKEKRELIEKEDPQAAEILKALDNPNYKWYTVAAVAKDIKFDIPMVQSVVDGLVDKGLVVASSSSAPTGEPIYTSTERYLGKGYLLNRILTVISGEIK